MKISNLYPDPFRFTRQFPHGWERYRISGSHINCAAGNFGTLLLQTAMVGDSWVHGIVCSAQQQILLQLSSPDPFCGILISLEGDVVFQTRQWGRLAIPASHVQLLYAPDVLATCAMEAGAFCCLLFVSYPVAVVSATAKAYPAAQHLAAAIHKGQPAQLSNQSLLSGPAITSLAGQLVLASYADGINRFLITHVNSLLRLLYAQAYVSNPLLFSLPQVHALQAVKDFLDSHLHQRHSMVALQRLSALNSRKLQIGFRQLYGSSIKEYLLNQRLQMAKKQLLETSKPIKQIARDAGYHYTSNFCAAFKKMFGVTADGVRKG